MENTETTARRRGRAPELHTGEMDVGTLPDLLIPGLDEPLVRQAESIAAVDTHINKDYLDELKFMEEPVTIRIEPLREKNPPKVIDVTVNGVAEWIPVGREWTLKRKFVETLARSKPVGITTVVGTVQDQDPTNRVVRSVSAQYPFSVIRDANPKGAAWLTKIMQEG